MIFPTTAALLRKRLRSIPGVMIIAGIATLGIFAHLVLRYGFEEIPSVSVWPLYIVLLFGGGPLAFQLAVKAFRREFGSDMLAGISIVTSVILGEELAGSLVVLMLSGGETLEQYAVSRASSALAALAKRVPSVAHRKIESRLEDIPLDAVEIGDSIVIFPHDVSPVDGVVIDGHGVMDESYLTGEPFEMSKTPGSDVLSGAVNGDSALTIRASRKAIDSRYAKIMRVMRESEQSRPRMRRLGDQLGAIYTPVALSIALVSWWLSGDATRFLAVLVVATPCPLLIAIPVAIIGSISLAAKRGIIVRDPVVLERLDQCRTIILDKTGTLTYGEPTLSNQICADGIDRTLALQLVASLERYSKHPLSRAIVVAAQKENLFLSQASQMQERPGQGLTGVVDGRRVRITGRNSALREAPETATLAPPSGEGLECVVLLDGKYAATYRFHDEPRGESQAFIRHLGPKHAFDRVMIVSGDRESEVRYLAERVGIKEVYAEKSPEEKVEIVRAETARANTLYLGDGINDAPALMTATVGIAFGQNSDITTEAAGAVILDTSLRRVDEFFHISRRMRRIALESAVGGMAISVVGMFIASGGWLSPVAGALTQEVIDLASVLNALRAATAPPELTDF